MIDTLVATPDPEPQPRQVWIKQPVEVTFSAPGFGTTTQTMTWWYGPLVTLTGPTTH